MLENPLDHAQNTPLSSRLNLDPKSVSKEGMCCCVCGVCMYSFPVYLSFITYVGLHGHLKQKIGLRGILAIWF